MSRRRITKMMWWLVLVCLLGVVVWGWHLLASGADVPWLAIPGTTAWSIGLYEVVLDDGSFRTHQREGIANPILTADIVTGRKASFVADPFLVRACGKWHCFFEVGTPTATIGLATSEDGTHWSYAGTVLEEPFHLSYPQVFSYDGTYYMLPETAQAGEVRLYRASKFPTQWEHARTLLKGRLVDPTIFAHEGRWWMMALSDDGALHLYSAPDPFGPWTEHPQSPIVVGDPERSRPAGSVISIGSDLIRVTQDGTPVYGSAVRLMQVLKLTPTEYEERERADSPLFAASGGGWNEIGMHQLSMQSIGHHRWLACVDGCQPVRDTRIYVGNYRLKLPPKLYWWLQGMK